MTTVFIGGSRNVKNLDVQVRQRLDQIIAKDLSVLVGDANGADKAVQHYLFDRGYDRVEVFCVEGVCRNNVGGWKTRDIPPPPKGTRRDYYTAKDAEMTREGSIGLMLWDGSSRGTLANIFRLIDQQKKVVVYVAPEKKFVTMRSERDLQGFLCTHGVVHEQPALDFGNVLGAELRHTLANRDNNDGPKRRSVIRSTRRSRLGNVKGTKPVKKAPFSGL